MNHAVIPFGEHFVSLAVTRSLGRKKIKTTVVSENKYAMSFFSKYCHEKKLVDDPITRYSEFTKNDIIMPIGEDVIIGLARNLKKYRFTPAFQDYSVLELAFNKKKLIDRAIELNVPCPETIYLEDDTAFEERARNLKFPVVIKPVHSRGRAWDFICRVTSPTKRNIRRFSGKNLARFLFRKRFLTMNAISCHSHE